MSKKMQLSVVRLGSPRAEHEGLRIGTVRFLPRGIPKADYARKNYFDVWMPLLSPSPDLLRSFKAGELTPNRFFARFKTEMAQPESRQSIILLAHVALQMPIAVGCYCEDASRCHRSVLAELIQQAIVP